MPRKNRRQTKTAAKEEKRCNKNEQKKQQDLRKALFLATRAKKKADRLSDGYSSPTKSVKTVSPDKDTRTRPGAASPRTSNRLKELKARHARELSELQGITVPSDTISETESKSVVNVEDESDTCMEMSSVEDQDENYEDEENTPDPMNEVNSDKSVQGDCESENNQDQEDNSNENITMGADDTKDASDEISDNRAEPDRYDGDEDGDEDVEDDESTDTPVRGSNRYAALGDKIAAKCDDKPGNNARTVETAKKDAYDKYNKRQKLKSKTSIQTSKSTSTFLDGYKNPPYKHVLYCKVKMPIPSSETPTKTLHDAFAIVIKMLRHADPLCVIFKFKDDTNRRHITTPNQIPQILSKMKEYFDGAYRPASQASTVWCEVKIGFNVDKETMFDDVKYLLKEHGDFAFYEKALQYRKVVCFGYLLFSTWTMDKKRVVESIELCCEQEFQKTIIINAVWRKISDPFNGTRRWNKKDKDSKKFHAMQKDEDVKALHLECEAGKEEGYAAMVAKLYSTQRTTTPCGEAMRFVGYSTRYQNSDFLRKLNTLRNRQAWFTASIGTMRTYEIAELDYKASKLKFTMRRLLMEMVTNDDKKLFWTVDESWNKDGIIITFPLKHGEEARNRVADLGPYIFHFEGERTIKKYFTPSAAERALVSTWDEENNRAISQEEEAMDDLLASIDNDMSFMGDPNQATTVDTTQIEHNADTQGLRPTRLFNYDPQEDESLGTFGQQSLQGQQQVLNLAVQQNNIGAAASRNDMIEGDDLTHDGELTVDTLSSRMSVLESNLSIMAKGMDTLIGHLQQQHMLPQAPVGVPKQTQSDASDSDSDMNQEDAGNDNINSDNGTNDNETRKTTRPSAGNAKSYGKGSKPAGSSKGPAGGP